MVFSSELRPIPCELWYFWSELRPIPCELWFNVTIKQGRDPFVRCLPNFCMWSDDIFEELFTPATSLAFDHSHSGMSKQTFNHLTFTYQSLTLNRNICKEYKCLNCKLQVPCILLSCIMSLKFTLMLQKRIVPRTLMGQLDNVLILEGFIAFWTANVIIVVIIGFLCNVVRLQNIKQNSSTTSLIL